MSSCVCIINKTTGRKMKTNADYQKDRYDREAAIGRTPMRRFVTTEERKYLDECLAKYRKKQERLAKIKKGNKV